MKTKQAVVGLFFLGIIITAAAGPRETLDALVADAMEWSPRVRAAACQLEQADAARAELRGFFDPNLAAGAEHADTVYGRRATVMRAGVTTPVVPGVYLDAALEERVFDKLGDLSAADTDYEQLIQSMARVSLNVPLLQDRGWRQWTLADLQARHAREAAYAQLLAVRQEVRREVEQQYLDTLETRALVAVAAAAAERAEKLLREAESMVSVQALPEYQVHAARSAAALRQEEEIAARLAADTARLRLAELIAAPRPPQLAEPDADQTIAWAAALHLPGDYHPARLLAARGNYARVLAQIEADRAARDLAADQLRSKLGLVLETTLQGEDPDNLLATGRYLSSRNFGVMGGVVWSRPWGYRAEKSRVRARAATMAEQGESLRQIENRIVTDLAVAHGRFARARGRLRQATTAVDSARQALTSEDERFRLGEGRSRNVLDAQKDLTDALKRQIVVAVELLRAYYEFNFAAGYALAEAGEP